jgi:hypothetical protein
MLWGNILEVEAAYKTFKKESELKFYELCTNQFLVGFYSRLYLMVNVWFCYKPWRKQFSNPQMLLVNIDYVPTVSVPSII